MAEVTLTIGDRNHIVACRDGEEPRLHTLGAMLDERWPVARRAAGNAGTERAMLLLALILADDLDESVNNPAAAPPRDDAGLAQLAERLERLADTLEHGASNA